LGSILNKKITTFILLLKTLQVKNILLLEDDLTSGMIVRDSLSVEGYGVSWLTTCFDAKRFIKYKSPDLIIFDILLPDGNGYELARELRQDLKLVPFIFLTSCDEIEDIRKGFELGCEDYIKKPIRPEELILRVKKILGDLKHGPVYEIKVGSFKFSPISQKLISTKEIQSLGNLESSILHELIMQKGETVNKYDLLQKYWKEDSQYNSRNLDSVIVKLRKRLFEDENIRILSLKRIGYRLVIDSE
jgi:DNA-binding response OmpR family regulator